MDADIRVRVSGDKAVLTLVGPKPGHLYSIPTQRGGETEVLELLLQRARNGGA